MTAKTPKERKQKERARRKAGLIPVIVQGRTLEIPAKKLVFLLRWAGVEDSK